MYAIGLITGVLFAFISVNVAETKHIKTEIALQTPSTNETPLKEWRFKESKASSWDEDALLWVASFVMSDKVKKFKSLQSMTYDAYLKWYVEEKRNHIRQKALERKVAIEKWERNKKKMQKQIKRLDLGPHNKL